MWELRQSKALRILTYHGIVEDEHANKPWVPSCFVSISSFRQQLEYLKENATLLPLNKALEFIKERNLPKRAVCLTFDDGYANNLYQAFPLLEEYKAPATIFLSTAYIENGDFFPFDRLCLIKLLAKEKKSELPGLIQYKDNPLDLVIEAMDSYWKQIKPKISNEQISYLRPLRIDEIRSFDTGLIDFGAHSHNHCILGNEDRERRDEEINLSIRNVEKWTGQKIEIFSYPNGQQNDFDDKDKALLRTLGIKYAVTTISGKNYANTDPWELRRFPVGINHDYHSFVSEVTGMRTLIKTLLLQR